MNKVEQAKKLFLIEFEKMKKLKQECILNEKVGCGVKCIK